jgi:hypothetical protein
MTDKRVWQTASVLTDGKVIVIGGYDDKAVHNTAELFNYEGDGERKATII